MDTLSLGIYSYTNRVFLRTRNKDDLLVLRYEKERRQVSCLRSYEGGFMNIVIYTQDGCGYCTMATHAFEQRGWNYTAKNIGEDTHRESLFENLPNVKTVPQIWINDVHIGGYNELKEWLKKRTENALP